MSYILDALRRADAERERERGAVPGLHAQSLPGDGLATARDRRPLLLATAAAAILLAAVLLVIAFGPWSTHPTAVAVAPEPVAAVPEQAPASAPAGQPGTTVAEAPSAPPVPPLPPNTRVAAETSAMTRPPTTARPGAPPQGRAPAAPRPVPRPASPPVEHHGEPPPPAARPGAPAKLSELAPAVRASLPRLTPGGAIYADVAAERMLILNGQVYHEGDKPASDTTLEKIRHRSAVLNFRGTRYEIEF